VTIAADGWPWRVAWLAALSVVLIATTAPWTDFVGHVHWGKVEWVPFTHRVAPRSVVLNVLLFVPFGYAGRRAWPRTSPWWWLVTGCALSLSVETYQLFTHSRLPSSVDVITNTMGATIGAVLAGRCGLGARG